MAKNKMSGFWAGILVGAKPALDAATKFMEKFDFAKLGLKIGLWLDAFRRAIKDGKFGELLSLSIQIGSIEALNFMVKGFQYAFIVVKRIIKDTFNTLSDSDFWIGLGKTVGGVFMALGAGLIELFTTPIKYMDAAFTVLFSRITGPWANGISKSLLTMMSPMVSLFDKLTGGKIADKLAELISGTNKDNRTNKGKSFKEALADTNKKPTWLESQGKDAAILSGKWLDDGLAKLKKATKDVVSPADFAKLGAEFFKNAADMFPTKELRKQFETIMKPYRAAAYKDYKNLKPAGGRKELGKTPDQDNRGFVGFKDAIRKEQESAFKQREKTNELLTQIRDGNKGAQEALFGA